jgi:sulfoxide reductase heme-binding subunit YedZ
MKWAKAAIFLFCLGPLAWLLWGFFHDELGGNPVEYITHSTGDWTMRFLLLTLLITPLRKLSNQQYLIRLRRMLGLFAFIYACLHFATYLWLDQSLDLASMSKDILKRPFITAGFAAFVTLVPLAVTSTKKMIALLGGKRWQMLHRLIYFSAVAGVIHYWWLVKSDIRQPLMYGIILTVLLVLRLVKLPPLIPARASVRNPATR